MLGHVQFRPNPIAPQGHATESQRAREPSAESREPRAEGRRKERKVKEEPPAAVAVAV